MAKFNEILEGRYNRFLQKLLTMKGGPPAPQLASDIVASLPLFMGREGRYLEGWATGVGGGSPTGVAGNKSAVRIRNPISSGVIAVIEKILVMCPAADVPTLSMMFPGGGFLDLPTVERRVGIDPRSGATNALPGSGLALTVTSKNNNAVTNGTTFAIMRIAAGLSADFIVTDIQEIPLLPDCAIDVTSQVANQEIDVDFIWRERPIGDSEKF